MRKKSSYKPKRNLQDPLSWVINGFKPITTAADQVLIFRVKNHAALKAACEGVATWQDVNTLVAAMNITEALEKIGVSQGWADEIAEGHQAIVNANARPKFLFTGTEMTALNLAMDIHDAQVDKCTIGQLDEAVKIVKRVVALKKARILKCKQLEAA